VGRSYNTADGAVTPFEGQEVLSAFVVPEFTVSQNNLSIGQRGFLNASLLSLSATGAVNLTGLAGALKNREVTLLNTGAATITLKNANAGSVVANRFNFGADVALGTDQSIVLLALVSGGWAIKGAPPASGGGAPSTATFVTTTNESSVLPDSVLLSTALQSTGLGARVYLAASDSPTNPNTITPVPFDTAAFDVGGFWVDTAPTVFTVPVAGLYSVAASILWDATSGGERSAFFTVNSAGIFAGSVAAPGALGVTACNSLSTLLSLNAGDTVSIAVFQNSGTNAAVIGSNQQTTFSIFAVH
jgi:C1q domain